MAKAFFFQDQILLTWKYGSFANDGVTPEVEFTIPAGNYRSRWQSIGGDDCLTIVNANNLGELVPIRNLPIDQIACDLIGTPYASKAAFESANANFFFKVGTSGSGGSNAGFGVVEFTGDNNTVDFTMPSNCDITGDFYVSEIYDVTLLMVGAVKTARFAVAPTSEQFPRITYSLNYGIPVQTTGNVDLTDDHTLALTDVEKTLWMNSANPKAITIPLHATVGIPLNTRIELVREGAGTLKILFAVGVTLKYDPDGTGLATSGANGIYVNSVGSLIKRSDNVWILVGVLTAV